MEHIGTDTPGGLEAAKLAQQQQRDRMFTQQVQRFIDAACSYMAPGTKGALVLRSPLSREQDVVFTAIALSELHAVIAHQLRHSGYEVLIPSEKDESEKDESEKDESAEIEAAVERAERLAAAIRRAMPFISGPGSDAARKLLMAALVNDEETKP